MKYIDTVSDIVAYNNETYMYKYVIVKIGAKWCNPCMRIKEELEEYIKGMEKPSGVFIDLDVDIFEDIDECFEYSKIPFFIIYKDGLKMCEFNTGNMDEIKKRISSNLEDKEDYSFEEDF